jgi:inner membrane protein
MDHGNAARNFSDQVEFNQWERSWMSPVTHILIGWLVGNGGTLEMRERTAITLAGVAPDLDGAGLVAEYLTRDGAHPLMWYSTYHHVLGHNLLFGMVVTLATLGFARDRWKTCVLSFFSFHLHLLGDIVGSRGPDGFEWPIQYLFPFSTKFQLCWQGQWELNAWPNFAITAVALLIALYVAWKKERSPVAMFSVSADQAFVKALRKRFSLRFRH